MMNGKKLYGKTSVKKVAASVCLLLFNWMMNERVKKKKRNNFKNTFRDWNGKIIIFWKHKTYNLTTSRNKKGIQKLFVVVKGRK